MFAGPTESLDRYSIVGLPLTSRPRSRCKEARLVRCEGEGNAWTSLPSGLSLRIRGLVASPLAAASAQETKRQGLPDGAAMPLEGFQENLRLGESLPIIVVPRAVAVACLRSRLHREVREHGETNAQIWKMAVVAALSRQSAGARRMPRTSCRRNGRRLPRRTPRPAGRAFFSKADVAAKNVKEGMEIEGGAAPVAPDADSHPNHHLIVHVFDKQTGKAVTDATVTMSFVRARCQRQPGGRAERCCRRRHAGGRQRAGFHALRQ